MEILHCSRIPGWRGYLLRKAYYSGPASESPYHECPKRKRRSAFRLTAIPALFRQDNAALVASSQRRALEGNTVKLRTAFVCAWGLVAPSFVGMTFAAADLQPYTVTFAKTPDSALNAMLQGTSDLSNLRKSAPVGAFALIGRAQSDIGRLQTVLQSFGYYQGSVTITVDTLP